MKFPTETLAIANLYALLSAINASVAPIVISLGELASGANSFVQQYRYPASDYVQDTIKSQAIPRVLIGPQLAMQNKDLLYPIPFAGAFLSGAELFVIGFLVLMLLSLQIPETRKTHRKEGRTSKELIQDPTLLPPCYAGPLATR